MKKKTQKTNSKFSFSSTFNWEDSNLKQLLKPISNCTIIGKNDAIQPLNQHHHKNLNYKQAPFMGQQFYIYLNQLTNIKYVSISNFTTGSQMTISIAKDQNSEFQQVYKDKYICKGKTLKDQRKDIDIGALPCKVIRLQVNKGSKVCSNNISLIGMDCQQLLQKFGQEYYKLLVSNPMRILYLS